MWPFQNVVEDHGGQADQTQCLYHHHGSGICQGALWGQLDPNTEEGKSKTKTQALGAAGPEVEFIYYLYDLSKQFDFFETQFPQL